MIFGKHINRYYLKYGWMLLLGVLALIVVDFGQLKIPEFYRMVINGMNSGRVEFGGVIREFDMDFLLDEICRPLLIIIIAIVTGRFLWRVCFFGAAIKVETDLRDRMFDHCKDLSQQYYQVNKVGNMMSLFTNDLETVQDCYGNGVLMLADAVVLGGLALAKMLRMNIVLTLLCMIPAVLMFIVGSIIGKYMTMKWERRQEVFSELSDFSQESFSGIAVIKAFAREVAELLAFKKLNESNEKINVEYTRISTLLRVVITLFVESVICVILGYGGYLVYKGVFNAGQMMEFIGYFTAIVWPIEAVAMLIEMHARGSASLNRISDLLDAPINVYDREDVVSIGSIKGDIEAKHLDFTYPGCTDPAMTDVCFKVNAGENIGIIGRTGSGKTTLVDLIARIYNVPDGRLFVDGHDVNTIPIKELREAIAYVPQDNFLFSDTIANNIAFSIKEPLSNMNQLGVVKAGANQSEVHRTETQDKGGVLADRQDRIEEAAKRAGVHENIVEFTDQYETVLGERGVTVSGGQKQRISIARALMKKAPILILDDSVSAVDTATEKLILDNLKETRKGKTTILIAHRISTVERMDKIIFIDEGRVKACATHKELLETCPDYAEMVRLQRLEDERKERGLDA